MKVSSASDYSWIYTMLNNNINRTQTSATNATTSSQQVGGISNIDGDSFVLSAAGQSRGSLPVGMESDSSALDLKSFLDKVKNGTVTQDDLDAMKEKLNSSQVSANQAPPPPPQGAGDQIKTFLDKVASGTVTDADLEEMQTWLSQATQSSQSADGSGDQIKTFLDKVAAGTVTDADLEEMQTWLSQAPPPPPPPQGAGDSGDQIKTFLDKVAAGTVTDADLEEMQTWLSQATRSAYGSTDASADGTASFDQYMASVLYEAYSKTGKIS